MTQRDLTPKQKVCNRNGTMPKPPIHKSGKPEFDISVGRWLRLKGRTLRGRNKLHEATGCDWWHVEQFSLACQALGNQPGIFIVPHGRHGASQDKARWIKLIDPDFAPIESISDAEWKLRETDRATREQEAFKAAASKPEPVYEPTPGQVLAKDITKAFTAAVKEACVGHLKAGRSIVGIYEGMMVEIRRIPPENDTKGE